MIAGKNLCQHQNCRAPAAGSKKPSCSANRSCCRSPPAAGLLLGIGGALSNPNTVEAYPFLDVGWLQSVFTVMASAGAIVFANLAALFAVGVAVGLAKSDKGTAGWPR